MSDLFHRMDVKINKSIYTGRYGNSWVVPNTTKEIVKMVLDDMREWCKANGVPTTRIDDYEKDRK